MSDVDHETQNLNEEGVPSPRLPSLMRKPQRGKASPRVIAPIDDAFRDGETGLVGLENSKKFGSSKLGLGSHTSIGKSVSGKSSHTEVGETSGQGDAEIENGEEAQEIAAEVPESQISNDVDVSGSISSVKAPEALKSESIVSVKAEESASGAENIGAQSLGSVDNVAKSTAQKPEQAAASDAKGSLESLKKSATSGVKAQEPKKDTRKSYMLGFFKSKGSKASVTGDEKEPLKKKDISKMVKISSPTLIGPPPALSLTGTPIGQSSQTSQEPITASGTLATSAAPISARASPESIRKAPREMGSTFKADPTQTALDAFSKQIEKLNHKFDMLQTEVNELKTENAQLKMRLDALTP